MTCNACGEKPKNTAKDFTKAVIEINNPETLVLLRKVVIPASMGTEEQVPPAIGKYHNVILHYEANNHTYLYSSDGIPTLLEMDVPQQVWDSIDTLQQEIEDMKNSPDVVDIVDTYADLTAYDTSQLGDKDVIRVLNDETHDDESTYYRWSTTTQTWTYIGSTGPKSTRTQWTGEETNQDDTGTVVNVTTTTGDFKWEVGNTITVNYTHKATRNNLKIDSVASYPIDDVKSLAGGLDSGIAIQYICVIIANQRYYRPIGRLRASSDVAGPVLIADNLTTTGAQLTALSANQGKALKDLIDAKQNALTFDDTPTTSSNNPVKSGGIKSYVDGIRGLARELTIDDYNYHSTGDVDNGVALWLLEPGLYYQPKSIGVYISKTEAYQAISYGTTWLLTEVSDEYHSLLRWDWQSWAGSSLGGDGAACGICYELSNDGTMQPGSPTFLMTQNAITQDGNTKRIRIGYDAHTTADDSVAIGTDARSSEADAVCIGHLSFAKEKGITIGSDTGPSHTGNNPIGQINIGYQAGKDTTTNYSVSLGAYSKATHDGEVNIGTPLSSGKGYNNTDYRLLSGLHDGQDLHDAATLAQGNKISSVSPTTSTKGVLGQLYTNTTNMHTYQCTAIDTTDPSNPVYTWTQRW